MLELSQIVTHLDRPHLVREIPAETATETEGIEEVVGDTTSGWAADRDGKLVDEPLDGSIIVPVYALVPS